MRLAVVVPVLDRPARVQPLCDSALASGADVWFVCSPGDIPERIAIEDARWRAPGRVDYLATTWDAGGGDFARKHNLAALELVDRGYDWLFLGADDLRFRADWIERALATHAETHACVIGTNDLGNSAVLHREHSTHTLVSSRYLDCGTIDDTGALYCELYDHNFVDNELVGTAMYRETYAQALDSVVEHLHPHWGKGTSDATYEKGQARFEEDRALFNSRRHLWGDA